MGITFAFVRKGIVYEQEVSLTKRLPDYTLNIRWDVFRDKLRPGQEEEWKLTIRNPQGSPVLAEMLATMYDASLDKIWKADQSLQLYYHLSVPVSHWRRDYADSNYFYFGFRQRSLKVPSFSYDHFVLPPVGYAVAEVLSITNDAAPVTRYARMRGMGAMKQQMKSEAADDVLFESEMISVSQDAGAVNQADHSAVNRAADIELRTNFAETAFSIRNFILMLRVRSASLSVCRKALRPGISVVMPTHRI